MEISWTWRPCWRLSACLHCWMFLFCYFFEFSSTPLVQNVKVCFQVCLSLLTWSEFSLHHLNLLLCCCCVVKVQIRQKVGSFRKMNYISEVKPKISFFHITSTHFDARFYLETCDVLFQRSKERNGRNWRVSPAFFPGARPSERAYVVHWQLFEARYSKGWGRGPANILPHRGYHAFWGRSYLGTELNREKDPAPGSQGNPCWVGPVGPTSRRVIGALGRSLGSPTGQVLPPPARASFAVTFWRCVTSHWADF